MSLKIEEKYKLPNHLTENNNSFQNRNKSWTANKYDSRTLNNNNSWRRENQQFPNSINSRSNQTIQEAPMNEWIFQGSQDECAGDVSIEKVQLIVQKLNSFSPEGIVFNELKIKEFVMGGVCSAMAFEFADEFTQIKENHVETFLELKDPFLKCIHNLEKKFAKSSEQSRIRQAAFNTIEVQEAMGGCDVGKNKIQALANLHGYKIGYCSSEVNVKNQIVARRDIENEFSKLPLGLYLLRTIEPSTNVKQEEQGHSMIYFKGRNYGFLYEPNYGGKYMKDIDQSIEIYDTLQKCNEVYGPYIARFYELTL